MNVFLLLKNCVNLMEVHEVLVDYNLTDKVRFFYVSLRFCAKCLFFYSYARSLLIMQATIGI